VRLADKAQRRLAAACEEFRCIAAASAPSLSRLRRTQTPSMLYGLCAMRARR
jgi:hypothetical protein